MPALIKRTVTIHFAFNPFTSNKYCPHTPEIPQNTPPKTENRIPFFCAPNDNLPFFVLLCFYSLLLPVPAVSAKLALIKPCGVQHIIQPVIS